MKEKYESADIVYSVVQLDADGYIVARKDPSIRDWSDFVALKEVLYITPKGHEFLAATHNEKIWENKISPILGVIGNVSLSIIESVAKGIAGAAIDKIMLSPPSGMP